MRILYITLSVFLLDQITKIAVKGISIPALGLEIAGMEYGQSIPIIGEWMKITFIENPNMAFGLEFGGKIFLTVVAILASIGIIYYLQRHRNDRFLLRLALALILAGAIGNLVDRVFYGMIFNYAPFFHGNVVDFIDFDLFTIGLGGGEFKFWPVFNVADAAVTIGVVLLLITGIPKRHEPAAITSAKMPLDANSPVPEEEIHQVSKK